MQRLRVEFRPSPNVDIATIFECVFEASRSSAVAGHFIRRIRDRCERISDVPLGGQPNYLITVTAHLIRMPWRRRSDVIECTVTVIRKVAKEDY